MPRDPRWSDQDAADFVALIAADDGQTRAVVIDDPESSPEANGRLTAGTDPIDFVELTFERDTIYTVLATGGTQALDVSVFDDEGYLLQFVDAGSLGVPEQTPIPDSTDVQLFDTVWQFRPDVAGTYYLGLVFADAGDSGLYQLAVTSQSGAAGTGGNTGPVGVDDLVVATRFASTIIQPLGNDFDADGDTVMLEEVVTQPGAGVAFLVEGELLYRSSPDFAGRDSFDVRISDGNGASDVQRIFLDVDAPAAGEGASLPEAQIVAYLYEAGLNRDGNIDLPGLNFWIGVLEGGASLREIARAFLNSNEFTEAFGAIDSLSDLALVEELYRNVLNREGEQGGIDFWTGQLARPEVSREDMLVAFAESTENMVGSPDTARLEEDTNGNWFFA